MAARRGVAGIVLLALAALLLLPVARGSDVTVVRVGVDGQLPVRVYIPYGTEWYGYLMRRLAERPQNLSFFLRSLVSKK